MERMLAAGNAMRSLPITKAEGTGDRSQTPAPS
jgi:hypothetical protein